METKQLIDLLEEKKFDLKRGMNNISIDFSSDYDLNTSSYLSDLFTEYADSQVDIYYSDLFEWAKYNYEYIEDAVSEFGIDEKDFDFIRLIQSGQFLYNERQLFEDEKDIIQLMTINYLLDNKEEIEKELEEKEIDEMFDEIENQIDSCSRLENTIDIINEYIKEEE